MFSVALIGAGRIGRTRLAVIRDCHKSVLRAVVDVDLPRAEELAAKAGGEASSDWRRIVTRQDVDIVIVSTPTKFHSEIATASLHAGKHVLCEKPLGRTTEEAQKVVDAALDSGCILKTGLNYRYMAHVRKAKQLLDDGALGPVYFLRCRYGHGGRPGYERVWCTDKELSGGGVLLEQGIHIFDLVRHFLGEPNAVSAEIRRYFWNFDSVEDNCFSTVETPCGQLAQLQVSWTQWVNIFEVEIFGRDGYLRLEGRDGHYGRQRLICGKRKQDHSRPEETVFEFGPVDESWKLEWSDFLRSVEVTRDLGGALFDGLRAQQMVDAAYESAERRTWINIPSLQVQLVGD